MVITGIWGQVIFSILVPYNGNRSKVRAHVSPLKRYQTKASRIQLVRQDKYRLCTGYASYLQRHFSLQTTYRISSSILPNQFLHGECF